MAVTRRTGARRGLGRLLVAAPAVTAALMLGSHWAYTATPAGGLTRKQMRGTIHNKDTLGDVVELPAEEEAPEPEAKEPKPERRVPYTMNIVSQFPQHKHLHEESYARKFIEEKLVGSLQIFEEMIRHVEVHLQVSENFHREKPSASGHRQHKSGAPAAPEEEPIVQGTQLPSADSSGHKMLAPYVFKATVTLDNQQTIAFANPEKHAQPTLTEAVDHMVDVLRKQLRERKEKSIAARKKAVKNAMPDLADDEEDATLIAESIAEAAQAARDAEDERLYQRVEAASDSN
eukprot:gb/GFBE01017028.1/.p1 GENE.gb/GFBE01017028.1/~~gb/GFBE01017028.1/.p1  ORF type:complete len:289 (+),score=84.60 gb/GFBE01017028.1/:1-867(+)